ncbi:unnamed protein product [Leptidea sinapis]|uniref:Uncharacterized protein n=1 Tax=Leptidea sinapis TaxID=189913 RepID=A0A5E4R560_9NEOP|nr:unnamed protein product [Leptidea sinapis]
MGESLDIGAVKGDISDEINLEIELGMQTAAQTTFYNYPAPESDESSEILHIMLLNKVIMAVLRTKLMKEGSIRENIQKIL